MQVLLLLAAAFAQEVVVPGTETSFSPDSWLVYEGDEPLSRILFEAEPPTEESEDWRTVEGARLDPATPLAYCAFESRLTHVRMARLSGAETLFVNGEPFWGDPDRRDHRGVPVALRDGINHLFVTGVRLETDLELSLPEKRLIVATWNMDLPLISRRTSSWSGYLHFPVLNASIETADFIHAHYGGVARESEEVPGVTQWCDGGTLPPLSAFPANVIVCVFEEEDSPLPFKVDDDAVRMRLSVWVDDEDGADEPVVRIPFRKPRRRPDRLPNAALRPLVRATPPRQHWSENPKSGTAFVYGTGGTQEEAAALLAVARYDQARIAYRTGCLPVLVSDEDHLLRLDEDDSMNWYYKHDLVVLYGNLDTNCAITSVVRDRENVEVASGSLRVGQKTFKGDDLHGYAILRDRADPGLRVGLVAHTGLEGIRRSFLHDFYFTKTEAQVRFLARSEVVVCE